MSKTNALQQERPSQGYCYEGSYCWQCDVKNQIDRVHRIVWRCTNYYRRFAQRKCLAFWWEKSNRWVAIFVWWYVVLVFSKDNFCWLHTLGSSLFCRYWYENGNVFPDMGTVWVAVDQADTTNGCMQVLRHLVSNTKNWQWRHRLNWRCCVSQRCNVVFQLRLQFA